ncbi:2,3-bisphosphoglycerate-independent phosphoglycerate mutase [Patescibacteria group bacterium]|nr:2,3-bisphosphoglycerate-independent phosphoglycerate mutase [Patescibacteria group bacterium]
MTKPLVLIIMDGWGVGKDWEHNPIFLAETPNIDRLLKDYPNTEIGAAGTKIGLTMGHQGSSEIGHLIMGAGRNVLLPQTIVTKAMETGELFNNDAYKKVFAVAKKNKSKIHLMGLLSDKGVHAYDTFCHSLIEMAQKEGLEDQIYLHIFSDGRDVAPKSVEKFIERLREKKVKLGIKRSLVASLMGRYYAMDRDHRWERTERAFKTLVHGRGDFTAESVDEAVAKAYDREETDEFITPTVILNDNGDPRAMIENGDAVIHFNYRVDRAIQLSEAFLEEDFEGFPREAGLPQVAYAATTEYYEGMKAAIAFRRPEVKNTLGEVLSKNGLNQFRISETEKWVYLTKIFNGIKEVEFKGEERVLLPSDKVATYDLAPKMKARKISGLVVKKIKEDAPDTVFINFANPDMLGHTGVKEAVIEGIETVDTAVGEVIEATLEKDGTIIVTADHGDAEICFDEECGQAHTSHTEADVPFILVSNNQKLQQAKLRPDGILADIAPTILSLLGFKIPPEMTGKNIIKSV